MLWILKAWQRATKIVSTSLNPTHANPWGYENTIWVSCVLFRVEKTNRIWIGNACLNKVIGQTHVQFSLFALFSVPPFHALVQTREKQRSSSLCEYVKVSAVLANWPIFKSISTPSWNDSRSGINPCLSSLSMGKPLEFKTLSTWGVPMGLMTEGNRCPAGLQELLWDIYKLNGCCIVLFIYLTDAVDSTLNVFG